MSRPRHSRFRHDETGADADAFIFRKTGSNEDDIFDGTNGRDVYFARGGNDNMTGNWGNDRLDGGPGNDGVYGMGGDDRVSGGSGNDYLAGDVGTDIVSGGRGADTFAYTANGPFLFGGGSGIDIITDFDPRGRDHDLLIMQINYAFGVSTFAQLRAGMVTSRGDTIRDSATATCLSCGT